MLQNDLILLASYIVRGHGHLGCTSGAYDGCPRVFALPASSGFVRAGEESRNVDLTRFNWLYIACLSGTLRCSLEAASQA